MQAVRLFFNSTFLLLMSLAERKIDNVFNLSLNKLHLLKFFTERREKGCYVCYKRTVTRQYEAQKKGKGEKKKLKQSLHMA